MVWKVLAIFILLGFYSVYFGKMIVQKRKGIQTDQIAKKKQKGTRFYIEFFMKICTYAIVLVQLVSIFMNIAMLGTGFRVAGFVIGVVGDILFAVSVYTMKDSWRAGIAEKENTEFVKNGIYSISRNPAFLGFYCMYIGVLLLFFNPVLLVITFFAILLLHLQVLQEEKYLVDVFGNEYILYLQSVGRYFGKKKPSL